MKAGTAVRIGVYAVACPTCKVEPGTMCKGGNNWPKHTVAPHAPRLAQSRAKEALEWKSRRVGPSHVLAEKATAEELARLRAILYIGDRLVSGMRGTFGDPRPDTRNVLAFEMAIRRYREGMPSHLIAQSEGECGLPVSGESTQSSGLVRPKETTRPEGPYLRAHGGARLLTPESQSWAGIGPKTYTPTMARALKADGWTSESKRGEPTWWRDPMGLQEGRLRTGEAWVLMMKRKRARMRASQVDTRERKGHPCAGVATIDAIRLKTMRPSRAE